MALSSFTNFTWNEDDFKAKPKKEIPHDVTAEPITAWRIWKVEKPASLTLDASLASQLADVYDRGGNPFRGLFGARLNAVGVNAPWNNRVLEAQCNAHSSLYSNISLSASSSSSSTNHKAPHRECTCGVWAVKEEKDLGPLIRSYNKGQIAYGRVSLWGNWFEHEKGFRAQYAQPYDVNVISGDEQTVNDLRAFYGCDVRSVDMPKEVSELPHEEGGYSTTFTTYSSTFTNMLMKLPFSSASPQRLSFKDAVAMFPGRFPVLERAAQNTRPANNPMVEWQTKTKDVNGRPVVLKNHTQIFRTPFNQGKKPQSHALEEHLRDVEKTLEYGTPDVSMDKCVRTMGGFRHYLGRDLKKKDKLYLRPLREPVLRDTGSGMYPPMSEWISEVSLQVVPG